MVRVCFSMLLLMSLSACADDQSQLATNAQPVNPPPAEQKSQSILACTGLPVAGQKCGLAFPKL
jgi:hypothetical protein